MNNYDIAALAIYLACKLDNPKKITNIISVVFKIS